jgi:sugar/nucleoside kinase (ribokinase family)
MVIEVMPSDDEEVSEVMPAMVESWRSMGAATDAAIVSALAPGSVAVMLMVGKSTAGSAATESSRYAKMPSTMIEAVTSVVSTGRRIQVSERFMRYDPTFGPRAVIFVPFDSNSWPLITTVSPPWSPLAITESLSTTRATVTGWTLATPSSTTNT